MKKIITISFGALLTLTYIQTSDALLRYVTRGFKHCTGTCDKEDVCKDTKKREWCEKNCAHKMDTKKMCETKKIENSVKQNIEKGNLSQKEKELLKKSQ